MRKRILTVTLTLALLCTQAFAGWTATPYVSGSDGTFYWDAQSVTYEGNNLKIWIADDFGEAQISKFSPGATYFSHKEKLELNCAKLEARVIEYVEYSEHLALGKTVVRNQNTANWNKIQPDTLSDRIMKTFCPKLKSTK